MTDNILEKFFSYSFEHEISELLMYRNYVFEEESMKKYVEELLELPQRDFIDYILKNYDISYLTYTDIFQFSKLEDGTLNICQKILQAGDEGYKHIDIGKMLQGDSATRKNGAYTKYGENHAKLACELGLIHEMSNTYFLTGIGRIFCVLDEEKQNELLFRLILRTRLIQRFIYKVELFGVANYAYEAGFLKESTLSRRKSNVKTVITFLFAHADENVKKYFENVEYKLSN